MGDSDAVSDRDKQLDSLLEALDSKRTRAWAWGQFLDLYSPVILQVVRHYEPDDDRAGDCYLFVCEQLLGNHCRRLRRFDPDGPAKFTTWLRVVTRNLNLDWRRKQSGRHRVFKTVTQMPDLEQEVFDCLYQKGLSFQESLVRLQIDRSDLTTQDLSSAVNNLNRVLTSKHFWLLSTRTPQEVSIESEETTNGPTMPIPVACNGPTPEEFAAKRELLRSLRKGYDLLEPVEKLLIRLRYEKGLSLEQIARLTDMNNRQQVDRELTKTIAKLQGLLAEGSNLK